MYTNSQKKFLLQLARHAIAYYLETKQLLKINQNQIDLELKQERGVFVTLTLYGRLRGCIGHIQAIQPLYLDVIENAVNAAFEDPRFYPLTAEELKSIKIEISVLSKAQILKYTSLQELFKQLKPERDGVILRKGALSATYLPQVWEEIPEKEDFLSSLCLKAGLSGQEWKTSKLEIKTYQVEKFEEE